MGRNSLHSRVGDERPVMSPRARLGELIEPVELAGERLAALDAVHERLVEGYPAVGVRARRDVGLPPGVLRTSS
jgi:hypothetical protein